MKLLKNTFITGTLAITLGLTACATTQTPEQIRQGQQTSSKAVDNLFAANWVVTQLNGQPVVSANEARNIPSLQFDEKTQRFAGADGCNRIMGSYTVAGSKLSFGQVASTMMACLDSNNNELSKQYIDALGKVSSYNISGKALNLLDEQGNSIIQFTSTIQPR